jgi:hypothetical protein
MKRQRISKEKWTFGIAAVAFTAFVHVMMINIFREELFGIVPGYAPHNFAFNMTFFLPANFLILVLSVGMLIRTLKNWSAWKNKKTKIAILFLTLPISLLWTWQIIRLAISIYEC